MLSCAQARQVVFDLIEGELDALTAGAVEEHRDHCTNCPPLVASILVLLDQLRSLPEVHPDQAWLDQLLTSTVVAPLNGKKQWRDN